MSLRNYITLINISKGLYQLKFENDADLGEFVMDIDGYFYWYPGEPKRGCYPDYIIKEIYEKLTELNKEFDLKIKEKFSK